MEGGYGGFSLLINLVPLNCNLITLHCNSSTWHQNSTTLHCNLTTLHNNLISKVLCGSGTRCVQAAARAPPH
jgi:hypothetical protein